MEARGQIHMWASKSLSSSAEVKTSLYMTVMCAPKVNIYVPSNRTELVLMLAHARQVQKRRLQAPWESRGDGLHAVQGSRAALVKVASDWPWREGAV